MRNCGDCGVKPGELHIAGCDVERCAECGGQSISCDCDEPADERMPWTGEWPGVVECREYGFWCAGPPWKPVPAGTPGATEDLNRLIISCRWDKEKQKFVLVP